MSNQVVTQSWGVKTSKKSFLGHYLSPLFFGVFQCFHSLLTRNCHKGVLCVCVFVCPCFTPWMSGHCHCSYSLIRHLKGRSVFVNFPFLWCLAQIGPVKAQGQVPSEMKCPTLNFTLLWDYSCCRQEHGSNWGTLFVLHSSAFFVQAASVAGGNWGECDLPLQTSSKADLCKRSAAACKTAVQCLGWRKECVFSNCKRSNCSVTNESL